jgi:hypothetical protein
MRRKSLANLLIALTLAAAPSMRKPSASGKAALWTKADRITRFERLDIRQLP